MGQCAIGESYWASGIQGGSVSCGAGFRVVAAWGGFRAKRCWSLRAWQGDSADDDSPGRQWYWDTAEGFKAARNVRKVMCEDSVVCLHRVTDVDGNMVEAMEHVELNKWLKTGLLQLPGGGAFRFGEGHDVEYLCGDAVQSMAVDAAYNLIVNGMKGTKRGRECEGGFNITKRRGRPPKFSKFSKQGPSAGGSSAVSDSGSDAEGVKPMPIDLTDDDITGWAKALLGTQKKTDPSIYVERKAQVREQVCNDEQQRWALQPKYILDTEEDDLVFTDFGREQMEHMGVHAHYVGLKVQCHPRCSMALSLVARHKEYGDIVIFNNAGTRGVMKMAFEKGLLSKPNVAMDELCGKEVMASLEGLENAKKFLGIVQRVTKLGLYMQQKWETRKNDEVEVPDIEVGWEICEEVKNHVDKLIADLITDEMVDFDKYENVRAINDELKKIAGFVQESPCLLRVVEE